MADVRKWWSRDLTEFPTELAGIWQDNTEALKQRLADYLIKTQGQRVLTGYPKIDANWVIQKGKAVFIAGSSGDGKSTFLNSLVYNMARAGENVLYISLEFEPAEVWEFLAFIHTHKFKDRMYLPPKSAWQQGKATEEDRKHMEVVLDDIRQRTSVPGLIDVQKVFSWDDIEQYWEAHNPKNNYSVVVVDYLYKLNVSTGKYQQESQAKNTMISRAINWCHQKASFVLISPSQVNRESHKAAKKDGNGYNLDSLYNSSATQQDADLAMSVFSDDECKRMNQISVKCLKFRGTEPFPEHFLKLDPRTKYVRDGEVAAAEQKAANEKYIKEQWAKKQEEERELRKRMKNPPLDFKEIEVDGQTAIEETITVKDEEPL
jgi:replicative DNA helicase